MAYSDYFSLGEFGVFLIFLLSGLSLEVSDFGSGSIEFQIKATMVRLGDVQTWPFSGVRTQGQYFHVSAERLSSSSS
jgi:hypothetical protein